MDMTPQEYFNSDWLKRIKTDMIEGRIPPECNNCKQKEDLGLKSTRGAIWKYYNTGPEPEYENMWFYNKYTADSPSLPKRIEVRFTNLCNMKCRMCDETSSSEWAIEKNKHNLRPNSVFNPNGVIDTKTKPVIRITEDKIAGLKDLSILTDLHRVSFTGGEPLIIKEYYSYLDFLIESNLGKKVEIEVFTNCSVYNPLFIDRLQKFKQVDLILSVDGVGKVAEYIRHGTPWETVERNVMTFNSLSKPINVFITVAISALTLLGVSSLAKFLMQVYEKNNNIGIKCYSVLMPNLRFIDAPAHLKEKMIQEIDEAIETITVPNYEIFRNELKNIRATLAKMEPVVVSNTTLFYESVNVFDRIRNENFEETFGVPLYPPNL